MLTSSCICMPFCVDYRLNFMGIFMALMISISGIRGVVGDTLTPETIVKYTSQNAFILHSLSYYWSHEMAHYRKNVLDISCFDSSSNGFWCDWFGNLSDQLLHLPSRVERRRDFNYRNHNPIMWNGLKFFASTGLFWMQMKIWILEPCRTLCNHVPWTKQGMLFIQWRVFKMNISIRYFHFFYDIEKILLVNLKWWSMCEFCRRNHRSSITGKTLLRNYSSLLWSDRHFYPHAWSQSRKTLQRSVSK